MKKISFFIIFLLLFLANVEAIDTSVIGTWSETIDKFDLVSGAGSNLIDNYQSATNVTVLDISKTHGNSDNWRVDVKRTDTSWDGSFTLYARRTSGGTGNGSISGGLSYIEIKSTDSELFSGAGNRSGIDLQYKLTGMSLSVSPANYGTTIIYTVVDIP